MRPRGIRLAILGLVAAGVGAYDLWQARAANGPFEWGHDLNGYYDLLARGFLRGHLYVPVEPSPKLLALENPWDPAVDDSLKWQDMALYGGRYYLYFGAAPAAALFAPWRLATGHDLPENFAICLLAFGGFLFACGALIETLELAGATPKPTALGFYFVALGVCQTVPFLLNRAAVYEIAIAAGYFFVSGGMFFLARGVGSGRAADLAVSGAMFGLAAGSRPHLTLAGAVAGAALAWFYRRRRPRAMAWYAAAWAAAGLAIAGYNFARFGNPLEFGFRYQLAGPGQNRVEASLRNLTPGFYYMALARPELSRVFPWIRMVFRFPFDSAARHPLPPDYFVEPTVGALWLAPFLAGALLWTRAAKRPAETRTVIAAAAGASASAALFLMSTHLQTQRYEADFVPLAALAAVASIAMARRRAVTITACVLIAYSAAANLALALAGPYDDFLRAHPERYVRLARRFSPAAEFRPAVSPAIALRLQARFIPAPAGYREPLVTIGHSHYCYFLYAERGGSTMRLVSRTNNSQLQVELPEPGTGTIAVALDYAPALGEMTVAVNGREALRHKVGMLVTAPAQVAVAENFADMGLTARRFTGAIDVMEKRVVEARR